MNRHPFPLVVGIAALFATVLPASAQLQPSGGSISGIVETTGPLEGLSVRAIRLHAEPLVIAGTTAASGAFTINGLPEGEYELCAEGGREYPDSCYWTPPPLHPRTSITGAQSVNGIRLRLSRAAAVTIRISDPGNLFEGKRPVGRAAHLVVAAFAAHGVVQPASLIACAPGVREYEVAVPMDIDLSLYVSSPDVALRDHSGAKASGGSFNVPFRVASPAVTGRPGFVFTATAD